MHAARGRVGLVVGVLEAELLQELARGVVVGVVAGEGVGSALLAAAEEWGRAEGYRRLTLSVFTENHRAKAFYLQQGWRAELETWYKMLENPGGAALEGRTGQ